MDQNELAPIIESSTHKAQNQFYNELGVGWGHYWYKNNA